MKKRTQTTAIIVHCSATLPGQKCNARIIDQWHRQRGWKGIGYHFVVLPDGTVEAGRPIDETGAHCIGDRKHPNMNPVSIGVCYVGGLDQDGQPADTRTEAQKRSLRQLIQGLRYTYPQAKVYGHRDFDSRKACPCFDARAEYKD